MSAVCRHDCLRAIDDHSRLAYIEVLADEKGETCAALGASNEHRTDAPGGKPPIRGAGCEAVDRTRSIPAPDEP
jgi:hypothetical protein